ncbi:COBRA-like protein 1 precursor [Actinidia rufa]|uniref:COBRA-like protein n=1 Tax=Actinidia rufa TaxID=165716 RepID=A0A7J0FQF5_9ERIC|nr:COBRA-like protein 1 precursor [Actinidia rufa]
MDLVQKRGHLVNVLVLLLPNKGTAPPSCPKYRTPARKTLLYSISRLMLHRKTGPVTAAVVELLLLGSVDPSNSFSSFNIIVGNLESNSHGFAPLNLTLEAPGPGYTCGQLVDTDPTISSVIGGQREEQVLSKYFTINCDARVAEITLLLTEQFPKSGTWKSTCTYSSYLANKLPVCCVSLSTFYNPTITSCPNCSCGCRAADQTTESCIREGNLVTQKDFSGLTNPDIVKCTNHMCPLRVHWHLKNNYQDYWRVKLTISNYNYRRNYSDWNVLVQHPGFSQSATTYSFNSTLLPAVGITNEVALFWGLDFYNSELLNADEKQLGSVTSDILLEKDSKTFTLSNGWAFPRRIYFNGENCEMPPPDIFPMLPNGSSCRKPSHRHFVLSFLIYLFFKTLVVLF